MIQLHLEKARKWFTEEHEKRLAPLAEFAYGELQNRDRDAFGKGWMSWPVDNHESLYADIDKIASDFRAKSNVTVVIGIGGSYLGARSVLSMVQPEFTKEGKHEVIFAGQQLSPTYHAHLLKYLDSREVTLVVVSKSGTTLEPSAVFHTFRDYLEKRYGEAEASARICAITDAQKGSLRAYADEKKYVTLPIPDDIGGRYSVLSAVGLLPMALAGVDYRKVMQGAANMRDQLAKVAITANPAVQYALARHVLYQQGFVAEALVTYEPRVADFAGWWQQLFGESQGKDGIGLYPTMLQYTTDLHSMGQYVQDSRKVLVETVLDAFIDDAPELKVPVGLDEKNRYLENVSFHKLQEVAVESVMIAHSEAGVPNIRIEARGDAESLYGELVYFFEVACAFGGYLLGINAFDQPGVEAYKSEMRARLQK
ncbi:glucose-6-phosphate isomerase [Alicyclobacillus hesperidum subsp. aegles]|uniref:glucose-6-phosphate isomerase n=1 Tax=Alicyclobacillus hesperidum TaxID=89784 RepID=UPI00222D40F1|nr:glucose-6-phosphate isomerase [Alicyclobacillus hesperidum]GLG02461.1 glucose-6-phosphate isomerase [Alicyclobacillus hesperidum subsp. aegles]